MGNLRITQRAEAGDHGPPPPLCLGAACDYFFSGSSFLPLSSGMYGLHGVALIGPGVFHTTLNWPFACTSPMNTGLCRGWFFSSIFIVNPSGALNDRPAIAAIPVSTSVYFAFSTACVHLL